MIDTYITKHSGIELKLKAVDPLALNSILYRVGISATKRDIAKRFNDLGEKDKLNAIDAFNQLFGYCVTRGIETPVPDEGLEMLAAMGFPVNNPSLARLYWLKHVELDSQEEAGEIMGLVVALTFRPTEEEKEEIQSAIDGDD